MDKKERITIRRFRAADTEAIVSLFYETVHAVNAADYSEDQLNAWAPREVQTGKAVMWQESLQQNITYAAEVDGKIAGFCDMTETGYLNRLYVHKNHQRQGIASMLVSEIEQEAKKRQLPEISTEASLTAKPFFEKQGYQVVQKQTVERKGVPLVNYQMLKKLSSS